MFSGAFQKFCLLKLDHAHFLQVKLTEVLHRGKSEQKKKPEKSLTFNFRFSLSLIVGRYASKLNCSQILTKWIINKFM